MKSLYFGAVFGIKAPPFTVGAGCTKLEMLQQLSCYDDTFNVFKAVVSRESLSGALCL